MRKQKMLSNAETASFCNQCSMLFQAGITPLEAMYILQNDTKSASGKELIDSILSVCQTGEPFHKALEATGVFPEYVLHMLTLGEESGNLDTCMMSLGSYYEKEESISDSIKNAVTYPFIMIVMMAVIIFVLISKVMPIFSQVYIELGSEMTGFSASLLHLGNSLNRYSIIFLVLIVLIFALYLCATKTSAGRKVLMRVLNKLPLTKHFYESVASQRFASGMAITLHSGMDTYSGLDIVSKLVDNEEMQAKIAVCKESLLQGNNFAEALSSSGIFNNFYSQMVGIGFKSGNIDSVFFKIADSYEKETDRRIQSIISILEPSLVILLSLIVGMILLSVILPLMGIMTSIG